MSLKSAVSIARLCEADISAAVQLSQSEKWNQTERDWQRLLLLHPEGCFAAFAAGRLIGTVTVVLYRDTAWVGMMLVAQKDRGTGVGKALLLRALQHCERNRIRRVGLDATPAGRPLYESVGFVPFDTLQRWERSRGSSASPAARQSSRSDTLQVVGDLDRRAFQPPREALLQLLLNDCSISPALLRTEAGPLRGYALARTGALAAYVGPLVALSPQAAMQTFDAVLEQLDDRAFIDVPVGRTDMDAHLAAQGFEVQRTFTRMSRGGRKPMETSELVFAIAGPELG
jgi:GNAT superfamily N-acetyltransferase